MCDKVWLVTGIVDFVSDDKVVEYNLGVFSTEQKARERAEKAEQEKDFFGHKVYSWVDITEMIVDEELDG